MLPFQRLADRFTLVFYDHRCNGRSVGAPVSSMTWENLTADADALRERLGYETWAVLGHSFGGQVALEYALRYPERLSDLILMDTGGDSRWTQEHAPELLARRGFSPRKVRLAERFFDGRTAPWEFLPTLMRLGGAYDPHTSFAAAMRTMFAERRTKPRAEAYRFGANHLTKGWTVMDRLERSGLGHWSWPGATTSSSRPSIRRSSPRGSRTLDCGSSSARATTPTTSDPTR